MCVLFLFCLISWFSIIDDTDDQAQHSHECMYACLVKKRAIMIILNHYNIIINKIVVVKIMRTRG